MKNFSFSLQSVYNIKLVRREQAERALAKAMAELKEANERLDNIRRERTIAVNEYVKTLSPGAADPETIRLQAAYLESLLKHETEEYGKIQRLKIIQEDRRKEAI